MNALVLIPLKDKIDFFFFSENLRKELKAGTVDGFRNSGMKKTLEKILRELKTDGLKPDFAVLRAQYGGSLFTGPELVNAGVLKRLQSITAQAPLHIPPLIALAKEFRKSRPEIPLAIVFETAFFTALPEREKYYALSRNLSEKLNLKRLGYHGTFHLGAVEEAAKADASKLISICLEPRPEIAAVMDGSPLLTTSGATPLEGLAGENSSGEIDPLIITLLNKKLHYGPEQINAILSQKSGILGLSGKRVALPEVFYSSDPALSLARKILEYRILLACGSCIAVMGGADMIVFSGKYHFLGVKLEESLRRKLRIRDAAKIKYSIFTQSLPSLLADFAESLVIVEKLSKRKQ